MNSCDLNPISTYHNSLVKQGLEQNYKDNVNATLTSYGDDETGYIHVAFAINRAKNDKYVNSSAVVIKSIILLSSAKIKFHIFSTDATVIDVLYKAISAWHISFKERITFIYHELDCSVWANDIVDYDKFLMNSPKLCTYLWISTLTKVPRLLFMDTNTLVIGDISEMWRRHVDTFKGNNAALSIAAGGMYYRFNKTAEKIPRFGDVGLNSGVILFDVVRYRRHNVTEEIIHDFNYYTQLGVRLRGDQQILNSVLDRLPGLLAPMPCTWNFRFHSAQCGRKQVKERAGLECPSAWKDGVYILHDTMLMLMFPIFIQIVLTGNLLSYVVNFGNFLAGNFLGGNVMSYMTYYTEC